MAAVTPQKRGLVQDSDQARILAALKGREATHRELHDAVIAALEHGGSVREVAELSGLSTNTISRWKRGSDEPLEAHRKLPA